MSSIFSKHSFAKQSMSRKGNCWDNAVAESFFKSIKYEWQNRFKFEHFTQLSPKVNEYMYWYNHKRLHSAIGYLTPKEKEYQIKFKNKVAA